MVGPPATPVRNTTGPLVATTQTGRTPSIWIAASRDWIYLSYGKATKAPFSCSNPTGNTLHGSSILDNRAVDTHFSKTDALTFESTPLRSSAAQATMRRYLSFSPVIQQDAEFDTLDQATIDALAASSSFMQLRPPCPYPQTIYWCWITADQSAKVCGNDASPWASGYPSKRRKLERSRASEEARRRFHSSNHSRPHPPLSAPLPKPLLSRSPSHFPTKPTKPTPFLPLHFNYPATHPPTISPIPQQYIPHPDPNPRTPRQSPSKHPKPSTPHPNPQHRLHDPALTRCR